MLETAVLIDLGGAPLYWHAPAGRSSAAIPDSRALWEALWLHRFELLGVAHTHPGSGVPSPSCEDLTTFAAVEAGLGVRLVWWIATMQEVVALRHIGPGRYDYGVDAQRFGAERSGWLGELRRLSQGGAVSRV